MNWPDYLSTAVFILVAITHSSLQAANTVTWESKYELGVKECNIFCFDSYNDLLVFLDGAFNLLPYCILWAFQILPSWSRWIKIVMMDPTPITISDFIVFDQSYRPHVASIIHEGQEVIIDSDQLIVFALHIWHLYQDFFIFAYLSKIYINTSMLWVEGQISSNFLPAQENLNFSNFFK